LASGELKVESLISHRFPIEESLKAYDVITGKKKEAFLGVLLTYPEGKTKEERRIVFPQVKSQTSHIKLGVLGAGLFANSTLLPILKSNKDFELVGIASSGGLHAQHSGKKFGFQYATSSEDEIINDPKVNTVVILTRHDSHSDLVVKALMAGKHVFVEKPLAINSAQLSAVSKQLKANSQALLTVGFNRRSAPLIQNLKSSLVNRNEALHAHYRVNAGFIQSNHWTQDPAIGGGRIIGEACHFIDVLTFLVGAPHVAVTAHALPNNGGALSFSKGKYSEDNVSMTFTFPDGSIGVVDYLANGDKSMPKERLEVFCEGMAAVLDDYVSLTTVKDGKRKVDSGAQDKGWKGEMAVFAEAIQSGGEAPIPYEQLIGVTKSTFAAVESIRSRNPIEIK
jgi:predicted dehydrogenase